MNILVTAIGSFSADCVVNSLKAAGHKVVGCDIYPPEWHAVSLDCNRVYQAPLAKSKDYIPFLLKICKDNDIDFLMPLTDLEIDLINANRKTFELNNIVLCLSRIETLAIARDKYALYECFKDDIKVPSILTFKSNGIEIPPSILPVIAKPVNGRSSEGLQRIDNVNQLRKYEKEEGYIIQEQIDGPVFTVDYVRNASSEKDVSIAREELLRTKNGAGLTVRITNDCRLTELVSHIGKTINVNGCVNMEFILNNDNYYLIDINPRFSAGVAFSKKVGYDMVINHLRCFNGQEIESIKEYQDCIVTKRYSELIIRSESVNY